ncbi:hypothetical protein [Thaumasiovibrio subtropicus]|uniref:hypothetical protein n=1 Tax=Thaumasiovibrio subtropicus TaxID=1891207 RepID=UPI00131EB0D8|nr:hypothetical protein [Thaumasiovibrio subtropicus]
MKSKLEDLDIFENLVKLFLDLNVTSEEALQILSTRKSTTAHEILSQCISGTDIF